MLSVFFGHKTEGPDLKEIREILDLMLRRIDRKLAELKELEKRIDHKTEVITGLLERVEELQKRDTKMEEVMALHKKGMSKEEIASLLKIPSGEIELLLRVCKNLHRGKNFLSDSQRF